MAQDCTIPCDAAALRRALHRQRFGDSMAGRTPIVAMALLIAVVSPILVVVAPAVTAIILALWGLVGAAVVAGQAWLDAAAPARQAMPDELAALVEANAARIHESRVPTLRARAAALSLAQPNFDTNATYLLRDLREATGEAWRCPCAGRRLPVPLPF